MGIERLLMQHGLDHTRQRDAQPGGHLAAERRTVWPGQSPVDETVVHGTDARFAAVESKKCSCTTLLVCESCADV